MNAFLERPENLETVAMVVLGAAFALAERMRPARPPAIRRQLRLDLAGLAVLSLGVLVSREVLARSLAPLGDVLEATRALASGWPSWVRVTVAMVIVDFLLYWIHRAMHTRLLWRTHEWHHSPEHLYWFSGLRTSPPHAFLFMLPQVLVPLYLVGLTPLELGAGLVWGVFNQFWTHANLDVSLGPLRYVIATPKYHRIHHARSEAMEGNFAVLFSLWDTLFGTFRDPEREPSNYPLGVDSPVPAVRMMFGI